MAVARKRARKTTAKSSEIPKVPQAHGGALNAGGTPGNKGGGRPPKAFKDFLASLRDDPAVQTAIEAAAKDSTSRNFKAALDVMTDYDDAKPAKKVEVIAPMTTAEREKAVRRILDREKARG